MLFLAAINIWFFLKTDYSSIKKWDQEMPPPKRIRFTGGVGLALWAAIIAAGRLIPYQQYWFD